MKKFSLFITVLSIVVLLTLAISYSALAGPEPVGERISFWDPPSEFTAGAPFNIRHGWTLTSNGEALGIYDFKLEVDGVLVREDFKMVSAESGSPDTLRKNWVYNFPDGMTGTHTFTGHWYAPCQFAVDQLGYPGPCATPNDQVDSDSRTMTINFVP
jgi:hypothetical protein